MKDKRIIALSPLPFFLVIYLAAGYFSGEMGSMPLLVAFVFTSCFALLLNPGEEKISFEKKISVFTRGGGEETIILMVVIFLLAGAFYSIADAMGAVTSIVNLGLSVLSPRMILPGLFLIGCLLSFSMGTSMGTITALAPIGLGIGEQTGASMALVMATVVGGAMFGDNLSFISDTTIAATRTQGVAAKDKFRANFFLVLPAVIITMIILASFPLSPYGALEAYDYSLISILPYVTIIISALIGLNVLVVLAIGIGTGAIVGLFAGSFGVTELFSVIQTGMGWMQNLASITLIVGGLVGLMKYYGAIDYLLEKISSKAKSKKGGLLSIGALVSVIDIAAANNTIAIITAGPLAKEISDEYGISPKRTASILDIFSSAFQGLSPIAPQILLASSVAGISPFAITWKSFYPLLMLIVVLLSILISRPVKKSKEVLS